MTEVVWINGRVWARDEARISAFDHGFLYGDSIYETVRTSSGIPFLLGRHLERLRNSARLMALELDRSDEGYRTAVAEALAAVDHGESALRVVVTRGVGKIGYDRDLCKTPTTLVYVRPMATIRGEKRDRGVRVSIVRIRRNDRSTVSPAAKTSNLLNNILGSFEAQDKGAEEGIMLNRDGYVAEGTMSNLFVVKDRLIRTAPVEVGILPGITRGFVIEMAATAGFRVAEERFGPDELLSADEAFLTGTTKGILPVVDVDGRPVGKGRPGQVTRDLIQVFDATEDRLTAEAAERWPTKGTKRPTPSGEKRR